MQKILGLLLLGTLIGVRSIAAQGVGGSRQMIRWRSIRGEWFVSSLKSLF